jgi:hypothetical protein
MIATRTSSSSRPHPSCSDSTQLAVNVRRSHSSSSGGFDSSPSTGPKRKFGLSRIGADATIASRGPVPTFVYVQRDIDIVIDSPSPAQASFRLPPFASTSTSVPPSPSSRRESRLGEGEDGGRVEVWDVEMEKMG